jgi:predicted nucleic acid-binding protein
VLQEFFVAAVHPKKLNLSDEDAIALLDALLDFPLHVVDRMTITHAFAIKKRYGVSYWDSAVIASAKALGCLIIYTEDLNDGQEYEGVRIVNPFK